MSHARSILLAGLLVLSAVVTGVGPAMAQTATDSGPVTYEYTGSPTTLIVDTSNLDGGTEFTVEYTTQGGPSTGTTVLARETYNTANLKEDQLLFFNDGAYESVNVTVSDYSGGEPTFDSKSGLLGGVNLVRTVVGTTGGDSDLTCDTSDKIGNALSGVENLDCTPQPGTTTVNTTGTDASQIKLDAYQSGLSIEASADNYQTSLDNTLADSQTQALILGKNAYIKALNNGKSKSVAKTEAKAAVDDFYAAKQQNLISEWNIGIAQAEYIESVSANESGISTDWHAASYEKDTDNEYSMRARLDTFGTTSMTLENGDSVTVQTVTVKEERQSGSWSTRQTPTVDITTGTISTADGTIYGVKTGPADNKPENEYLTFENFSAQYAAIGTQAADARSQIDTLAENTYSAYQQGEINNSDLVDPYVLASQQSPGDDFQGWAAAQLTLLGTNSPENFDQIGEFEVSTSGSEYEGVLFSQENPASGQFESGKTYDASTLGGTQYVVTSDRIVELDGQFTIGNITNTDGEAVKNVTIQKTTYETTNVTELKQQYEDLAKRRAEIEAREQNLRGSAGGGLLGGSSSSLVLVLVGIGALYAVSQRRTGGNN
ncbi:hypothetical protein HISP_00145 [Haloarcula hispanica N601]|uniref:Envelope protein N-terminal domain-containing protein n=1 Tax=Haloarcula hispanica N601 TaxID=1417673 RepID=V5THN8_HALHI|nr:hypothetical protein [Haloarcula hispanica]AHB64487.1 hypothetical protein HISP_00145 [Haloarcula hispanica N601]